MRKAARSRSKPSRSLLIAVGGAVLGVAALLAPNQLLALAPPCLFSALTGHDCWGCGITHAVVAALHGDFADAWQHNRLFVLVLPLLGWEWLCAMRSRRHPALTG